VRVRFMPACDDAASAFEPGVRVKTMIAIEADANGQRGIVSFTPQQAGARNCPGEAAGTGQEAGSVPERLFAGEGCHRRRSAPVRYAVKGAADGRIRCKTERCAGETEPRQRAQRLHASTPPGIFSRPHVLTCRP